MTWMTNRSKTESRSLSKLLTLRMVLVGAFFSSVVVVLTILISWRIYAANDLEKSKTRIDQYQRVLGFSIQENDYDSVQNISFLVTNDPRVIAFDIINRFQREIIRHGEIPDDIVNGTLIEYEIADARNPNVIIAHARYYVREQKLDRQTIFSSILSGLFAGFLIVVLCYWLYREIHRNFVRPLVQLHQEISDQGENLKQEQKGHAPLEIHELRDAIVDAFHQVKLANENNLKRVDVLTQVLKKFDFALLHIRENGEVEQYGEFNNQVLPQAFFNFSNVSKPAILEKIASFELPNGVVKKQIRDSHNTAQQALVHYEFKIAEHTVFELQVFELANGEFALTLRNISDHRKLENKMIESQKMEVVGRLSSGMAHDFNNLLGVILSNAELIKMSATDPKVNENTSSIIRATERGVHLTRSLISFARKNALKPKAVDLNNLVRTVVGWSENVVPANIKSTLVLQRGLWPIEADPALAENALLNLILNARDAMPDGGCLTIETTNMRVDETLIHEKGETILPGQYSVLSVSDTGTGMSPEIKAKVFDPFFTTKGPTKGSGVGLSMVQGFIRQSGGMVQVYSEEGVGTTIKLYYPKHSEAAAPENQPVIERSFEIPKMRILLVEDERALSEAMVRHLTISNHSVTAVENGDDAYEIFMSNPESFDVIITDIVMPGNLSGVALIKKIRRDYPDICAIFTSGYALEATVHGNGLRDEDIRLTKPISRDMLLEALEKIGSILKKSVNS